MKMLRQIGSVTAMNLRSLRQRLSTSLVMVIGIAGVVGVLISVLAMSTGMIRTMNNAGRDDRAIVLRNGSASDASSALQRDAVRLIMEGAGVKRDSEGNPIATAETMRRVTLFKKDDGSEVNVMLRGVGQQVGKLRPLVVTALDLTAELGERDDRHIELLGQRLERRRDLGDFLYAVLAGALARSRQQLDVVDDDEIEALLPLEAPRAGSELADRETARVVDIERHR